MSLPNIFSTEVTEQIIARIQKLTPQTTPSWGKMSVAQMCAHCCVTYEMVYENKHKQPGAFMRFILKVLVKPTVVGEKPYKRNSQTAPAFLITDERDFANEQNRLIAYIRRAQKDGAAFFDGRTSHSFGKLTLAEWNNMFYKHLDHHLTQFGV
ncbi:MAG TPA: DUF1569 domain-containing protein [Chitinophagales bacterium]|nr:DUF1569 domain-containing protein [Chitinophagales bacterium]